MKTIDYFTARTSIDPETGCWLWQLGTNNNGYGVMNDCGSARLAHRVALATHLGIDVASLDVVRHSCDNPACCNPAHLDDGTHADNTADKVARGRVPRGDAHWKSLLCELDVAEIRQRVRSGEGQTAIALLFGVAQPTVNDIASGKAWRIS